MTNTSDLILFRTMAELSEENIRTVRAAYTSASGDGAPDLSAQQAEALAGVFFNPHLPNERITRFELTCRMIPHVPADRVDALIETMRGYKGRASILATFLDKMDEQNPWEAVRKASVHMPPLSKIPEERLREIQSEESEPGTGESQPADGTPAEKPRVVVMSDSGYALTTLKVYHAFDRARPDLDGFISGSQAIDTIFAAFQPETPIEEAKHSKRSARSASIRKILRTLTLDDVLENTDGPVAAAVGSSTILTRDLELYKELQQRITECRGLLGSAIAPTLVLSGDRALFVDEGNPSQFLGWFKSRIDSLPEYIREAYEEVRDLRSTLDETDLHKRLCGLLAYKRLHSSIDRRVALGHYDRDLRYLRALPDAAQRADIGGLEAAQAALAPILSGGGQSTIMMSDLAQAIVLSEPLHRFRRTENEEFFRAYRAEFERTMDRFGFLFRDGGNWREDSMTESVPLSRLEKTIYGGTIGGSTAPLMSLNDFRAVRLGLMLSHTFGGTPEQFFGSMPIADFQRTVRRIIAVNRKMGALDAEVQSGSIESSLLAAPDVTGETFPRTIDMTFSRDLELGEDTVTRFGMPLGEIVTRLRSTNCPHQYWQTHRARIEREARFGLWSQPEVMQILVGEAQRAVSAADLHEEIGIAAEILRSPFVFPRRELDLGKPYFSREEALAIQSVSGFEGTFHAMNLGLDEVPPPAAAQYDRLAVAKAGHFLTIEGDASAALRLEVRSLREIMLEEIPQGRERRRAAGTWSDTLDYLNPAHFPQWGPEGIEAWAGERLNPADYVGSRGRRRSTADEYREWLDALRARADTADRPTLRALELLADESERVFIPRDIYRAQA